MAKIPRSERSVSFDPAQQPTSSYDAGAPGKALMGLGNSIGELSGALEEQQNKLDDFNTKMGTNDFQLGIQEEFNQYKTTINGDGKDFDTNWANKEDQAIAAYAPKIPERGRQQFMLTAQHFRTQRILDAQGMRLEQGQVHFSQSGDDFVEKHALKQVTTDPASVDTAAAGVENFIQSAQRDGMSEKTAQALRERAKDRLYQAYIGAFMGPDGKGTDAAKNMGVATDAYLKKAAEADKPLEGQIYPPGVADPGRFGYGGSDPARARYGLETDPKNRADFAGQAPQTDQPDDDPGSADRDTGQGRIDQDPKLATGRQQVNDPQRQSSNDVPQINSGRQLASLVKLSPFVTTGDKNHSIDLLKPQFASALGSALQAMPEDLRSAVQIEQGGRSTSYQAQLYRNYRSGRGGLAAPPGYSKHETGEAVDLGPTSGSERDPKFQAALKWLYANGEQYGVLNPPSIRSRDSGHFQFAGSLGGGKGGGTYANIVQTPTYTGDYNDKKSVTQAVAAHLHAGGLSPVAVAGILQNVNDESEFDPTKRHADQPRFSRNDERAYAHGLYQDGAEEWTGYQKWLADNHPKEDWRDPVLQTRYLVERLKGNVQVAGGNDYARLGTFDKLNAAKTPGEAAAVFLKDYLRPSSDNLARRSQQYMAGVKGLDKWTGGMALGGPVDQTAQSEQPGAGDYLKSKFGNQVADASGSTVTTRVPGTALAKGGYARGILEQQNAQQGVAVQNFPGQPTTQSLFRDLLRKNLPAIKNKALEIEHQQHEAEKQALAAQREQSAYDGVILQAHGKLTREWVDQQTALRHLTPTTARNFYSYLNSLTPKVTDPATKADLMDRVKDEPRTVMQEAQQASASHRLNDEDFKAIIRSAEVEQSADAKTPDWIKNTEQTVRTTLRPKEGAPEEEWASYNATMQQLSSHAEEMRGLTTDNQGRSHQKKLDLSERGKFADYAQKLIEQHKTQQLLTRRQRLAPPVFSSVDVDHMDFDTLQTAINKTAEAFNEKRISKEDAQAEVAKLTEMYSILSSEAKLAGKPIPALVSAKSAKPTGKPQAKPEGKSEAKPQEPKKDEPAPPPAMRKRIERDADGNITGIIDEPVVPAKPSPKPFPGVMNSLWPPAQAQEPQ